MTRNAASMVIRYFECRREYEQMRMLSFVGDGGPVRAPSVEALSDAKQDMIDARESLASEVGKLDDDTALQVMALVAMEKKS